MPLTFITGAKATSSLQTTSGLPIALRRSRWISVAFWTERRYGLMACTGEKRRADGPWPVSAWPRANNHFAGGAPRVLRNAARRRRCVLTCISFAARRSMRVSLRRRLPILQFSKSSLARSFRLGWCTTAPWQRSVSQSNAASDFRPRSEYDHQDCRDRTATEGEQQDQAARHRWRGAGAGRGSDGCAHGVLSRIGLPGGGWLLFMRQTFAVIT